MGTDNYTVRLGNYFIDELSRNKLEKTNLIILNAIKNGELQKTSDNYYPVTVLAYDSNGMLIAKGSYSLYCSTSATEPDIKPVPNACIKKGRLYFDKDYHSADANYTLYINNVFAGYPYDEEGEGTDLEEAIDDLIRCNLLEKPSNVVYNILLTVFSNEDGRVVQRYTATFTYKTSATPAQTYTFENVKQDNGRLKFDAIKGAKRYFYRIYEDGETYSFDFDVSTSNSIDVNNTISRFINEGMRKCSTYKIDLVAYDGNSTALAAWSGPFDFVVEPNPLSVKGKTAKVKYKMLRKKKQTLAASKVINGVSTGRGKMTFKKLSGNKKISINSSTGKVTIKKKGLKKRKTYKVKVKIFAAGNHGYDPSTEQTVTFKIKVK